MCVWVCVCSSTFGNNRYYGKIGKLNFVITLLLCNKNTHTDIHAQIHTRTHFWMRQKICIWKAAAVASVEAEAVQEAELAFEENMLKVCSAASIKHNEIFKWFKVYEMLFVKGLFMWHYTNVNNEKNCFLGTVNPTCMNQPFNKIALNVQKSFLWRKFINSFHVEKFYTMNYILIINLITGWQQPDKIFNWHRIKFSVLQIPVTQD